MKILHYTTQFKKDSKKYQKQPEKIKKLLNILWILKNDSVLPLELKAHKLAGQYKDCMKCHIEGDFLHIWFDNNSDIIRLLRLGSHSELFR